MNHIIQEQIYEITYVLMIHIIALKSSISFWRERFLLGFETFLNGLFHVTYLSHVTEHSIYSLHVPIGVMSGVRM